jgi:hypothetical protein
MPALNFDIRSKHSLLILLLVGIIDDVEELELVHALGRGHDAKPVTELVLLEELLGPVTNPILLANSIVDFVCNNHRPGVISA